MNSFGYLRAQDPQQARASIESRGPTAKFIAGGTSLVDLMKCEVESPAQVIDISRLADLARIENGSSRPGSGNVAGTHLRIGSMASNSDVAHHDEVKKRFPALSEALLSGASPQLRNMASVGGNLLQRTRCTYFRDPRHYEACNKRSPGHGCAALEGYNRSHAILGTSSACIATHPSDMCVALAALDASIIIYGTNGERSVPAADFHLLPEEHPDRETVVINGELITGVDMPDSPLAAHSVYLKVRDRSSYEFALASAAAGFELSSDGTIRAARLALGGVATKPWRCVEAEKMLVGGKADRAAYEKAAQKSLEGAKPLRFNAFKVALAKQTIIRAFEMAAEKWA